MRTRFIKINDISDIDTSKVTVQDLGNRYIDRQGNMFGLKYNRKNRKVNVIKIIRTPVKSADYYKQIIMTQRKGGISLKENHDNLKDGGIGLDDDLSFGDDNIADGVEIDFDPNFFISSTIELMQTHSSRLEGIMMNVKNSLVIPESDRMNSDQMNDIFRNVNIDGIQRIEKILVAHKELKNYPRSISYYLAKLDINDKDIIEKLDTDERKMSYIYASEMFYSIRNFYRTLNKILKDLNFFLESLNPDAIKEITFAEKQSFHDAKTSVGNTIAESDKLMNDIQRMEEHLSDASNF